MATPVLMPRMGYDMTEGKLVRWLKSEGDPVEKGEALAEIETSKVNIEIEAFQSGVLARILAHSGQTVPVGKPIAFIGLPGEKVETALPPRVSPVQASPKAPVAEKPLKEERVKASPLARRIAAERGIDLRAVQGTGPGGRIVREDVERFSRPEAKEFETKPTTAAKGEEFQVYQGYQDIPLDRMRKAIAQTMAASKRDIPHFYLTVAVEIDAAFELIEKLNALAAVKITLNDLIVKSTAMALVRYPELNASFEGDRVRRYASVNLAIAVALDGGLLTPVVHGAEGKSLTAIAAETKRLIEGAKAGCLRGEEAVGGTFTISNLGAFGVESFQAIINPPQVAILAVGGARLEPVFREGQEKIAFARVMRLTLSVDHRATDGAYAARFLGELRRILTQPYEILL